MLGVALGWGIGGGLVLGLALSVASTVVLLRAITDRGELDTPQGRIAIGWLIVEDLVTIVILVLLPTIATAHRRDRGGTATDPLGTLGNIALALGKAALFVVVMVVAGTRLVPRLLTLVSNEGSKELFTLAVLAIAIGFAFLSSTVFGVSFALGAFLAGAVVGESDMSHQAAADALPLRDAFAVLFFVSVGMLLDPAILLAMPLAIVAVRPARGRRQGDRQVRDRRAVRLPGPGRVDGRRRPRPDRRVLVHPGHRRPVARAAPARGLPAHRRRRAAVDRAQPGPLPLRRPARGAAARRIRDDPPARLAGRRPRPPASRPSDEAPLRLHAILCGYGQVGRLVARALDRRGFTYVVISQQRTEVEALRARGIQALFGEASNIELLERAACRARTAGDRGRAATRTSAR